MNKLKVLMLSAVIAVSSIAGFAGFNLLNGDAALAAETAECGNNAIIRCGAMTAADLKSKYAANDRGTQSIFSHYNISASDVANSASAKIGYVYTNGNVTVDGKTVATNAYTVGRLSSLGGTKVNANGWTVYEGADRLKSTLSAYVFFNSDGSFKSAVLRVCGNPVKATTVPVPVYKCNTLTSAVISRNDRRFNTSVTATNGASLTSVSYNFGDGSTQNGGATIDHVYAKSGTYTVTATANFSVDGVAKSDTGSCTTTVTIEPEMITVCDLTTNTIKSISKEIFDSTKHTTDITQCEKVTYCDTSTKTIVIVARNDKKDSYTTDLSKCNTIVCRLSDKVVITIRDEDYRAHKDQYGTDLSKCNTGVCRLSDKTIVSIRDEDYQKHKDLYSTDLTKCSTTVCRIGDKTIVTVRDEDYRSHKDDYTTDLSKCDTTVCRISDKATVTINDEDYQKHKDIYTTDMSKCENPAVPELPHTGTGDVVSGIVGLGALTLASTYYLASRRLA